MNDIITIAQSTFSRFARLKSLYLILVICILDITAMASYKDLSFGMHQELMIDCALAICLIVGLITAMASAFEIPRELRERTAQFILSKPMGRSAFVWGKFFGIGMLALFNIAFVTIGALLAYRLSFGETPSHILGAVALILVEAWVLTGIGLLLSIFMSETLAAIGVLAFFCIGHGLYLLPQAQKIAHILPNFYLLDIKTEVSHKVEIAAEYIGMSALYGLAYAMALTAVAVVLFSRKDVA